MGKREEDFIDAGIAYRMEHGKPMCIAGSNLADVERDLNRVISFEAGCEHGYQYAQTHPNWISVEDELPKVQDWYLCYNDVEDGSEVLHWEGDGNVWMDNDWHYKSKEITHWMPIVPPRKED